MNLIVDIGNSRTKFALFEKGKLKSVTLLESLNENIIRNFFENNEKVERAIVSSVAADEKVFSSLLNSYIDKVICFGADTLLPIQVAYDRSTLGADRLAAAVAAANLFPGRDNLVFDFGTAITIDLLTAKGVFERGNISPGMQTRYNALNHFTARLPLLHPSGNAPLLGQNTTEAITGGVENGIVFEIEGYISRLEQTYSSLNVVFTGGDAAFFARMLKSGIFVDPDLVLKGLNDILNYNR
jgi:type III pantothenate kinase